MTRHHVFLEPFQFGFKDTVSKLYQLFPKKSFAPLSY